MGNSCAGDFARLTFFRGQTAAATDFIIFAPFLLERHSLSRLAVLAFEEARHT